MEISHSVVWGQRIGRLIRARGFTSQEQFAAAVFEVSGLHCSQSLVSKWLRGERPPTDRYRPVVAGVLGVPVADLFSYEPTPLDSDLDEAVA